MRESTKKKFKKGLRPSCFTHIPFHNRFNRKLDVQHNKRSLFIGGDLDILFEPVLVRGMFTCYAFKVKVGLYTLLVSDMKIKRLFDITDEEFSRACYESSDTFQQYWDLRYPDITLNAWNKNPFMYIITVY